MSVGLTEYALGVKRNWRRWNVNRIVDQLPNRKKALILTLVGPDDVEVDLFSARGVPPTNLLVVESDPARCRKHRENGLTVIRADLCDVIAAWPAHGRRRIAAVSADFCGGFNNKFLAAITASRGLAPNPVISVNAQRGRDAGSVQDRYNGRIFQLADRELKNGVLGDLYAANTTPFSGLADYAADAISDGAVFTGRAHAPKPGDKLVNRAMSFIAELATAVIHVNGLHTVAGFGSQENFNAYTAEFKRLGDLLESLSARGSSAALLEARAAAQKLVAEYRQKVGQRTRVGTKWYYTYKSNRVFMDSVAFTLHDPESRLAGQTSPIAHAYPDLADLYRHAPFRDVGDEIAAANAVLTKRGCTA